MVGRKLTIILLNILLAICLFFSCSGKKTNSNDTLKVIKPQDPLSKQTGASDRKTDSIALTTLIKNMYKWHVNDTMKHEGFRALKLNPTDTLTKAIDLKETEEAIDELKQTGFFADEFLNDYRKIAVRMDKELRDGTS